MEQKVINQQWEYNFFNDGVFQVVYDYLARGKKYTFGVSSGSDFDQRLIDKNPRLKEIGIACIELQKEILQEMSMLPNLVYDINGVFQEFKECEIIKKHIILGNIRVDEDYDFSNLGLNLEDNLYVALIVDDIVYKDLCKCFIESTPDWKAYFKEHSQHEAEYNEAIKDIGRRQKEVINILAENGTDIYGSNL